MSCADPFARETPEDRLYLTEYRTQPCEHARPPGCREGALCMKYHSPSERRRAPEPRLNESTQQYVWSYSPSKCNYMKEKGVCTLGDKCKYAHTTAESNFHPMRYKTSLCNHASAPATGYCEHYGKHCPFSHSNVRKPLLLPPDWRAETGAAAPSPHAKAASSFPYAILRRGMTLSTFLQQRLQDSGPASKPCESTNNNSNSTSSTSSASSAPARSTSASGCASCGHADASGPSADAADSSECGVRRAWTAERAPTPTQTRCRKLVQENERLRDQNAQLLEEVGTLKNEILLLQHTASFLHTRRHEGPAAAAGSLAAPGPIAPYGYAMAPLSAPGAHAYWWGSPFALNVVHDTGEQPPRQLLQWTEPDALRASYYTHSHPLSSSSSSCSSLS